MQASDGGGKGASPCNNTLAAIGSGGVYSTPGDMMRWMQQFLSSDFYARSNQADRMQTLIYQRAQLRRVIGMDVPGKADALGMGWVYMAPKMVARVLFKNRWGWRIHHLHGDDSAIKRGRFCGGHPVTEHPLREYE